MNHNVEVGDEKPTHGFFKLGQWFPVAPWSSLADPVILFTADAFSQEVFSVEFSMAGTAKACSVCRRTLGADAFSSTQFKKPADRKCKSCVTNQSSSGSVGSNIDDHSHSSMPSVRSVAPAPAGPAVNQMVSQQPQQLNFVLPPLQQMVVTVPADGRAYAVVPNDELIGLRMENDKLRHRLQELEGEKSSMLVTLQSKDLEIETLRRHNEELKARIATLEGEMAKQALHIEQLDKQVKELQLANTIKLYALSIQDLNRADALETLLHPVARQLARLRKYRVDVAHFLNESSDSKDLIAYKRIYLRDKLKVCVLNPHVAGKLGKQMLEAVIAHLEKDPAAPDTISAEDKEDVDDWWNGL